MLEFAILFLNHRALAIKVRAMFVYLLLPEVSFNLSPKHKRTSELLKDEDSYVIVMAMFLKSIFSLLLNKV